jgi:hypothetical protein
VTTPVPVPATPRRRRGRLLLLAHAVAVALLSVLLLAVALQPTEDANIGAGLALLALVPFGLPWSLVALLAPDSWPSGARVGIVIGAAVLNLVLHATLRGLADRRGRVRATDG